VGLNVVNNKKNMFINSTTEVKVYVDDYDEIIDSYNEAENVAIMNIAKFLKTDVKLNKEKQTFFSKDKISQEEVQKETLGKEKDIYDFESNISLKGIKLINKCYEKDKFVRVTLSLDEENIIEVNKFKSLIK
tara:strand:+ start:1464 stop:1859 length:396 start_codon:yes stop_codon:yes gene_type:complete